MELLFVFNLLSLDCSVSSNSFFRSHYANIIWIHICPGSKITNFFLLVITRAIPWKHPEK